MTTDIASALIGALGGLVGGAVVAGVNIWTERRRSQTERTKLLSTFTSPAEIEKARIHAYSELWRCLEGISTQRPAEIAAHLSAVQAKLQHWQYADGGGLLISGAAELEGSTKAAFFAARDLDSRDAVEIWRAFHRLRRCLRRDLRIFEDENEEQAALNHIKAKLRQLEGQAWLHVSMALLLRALGPSRVHGLTQSISPVANAPLMACAACTLAWKRSLKR